MKLQPPGTFLRRYHQRLERALARANTILRILKSLLRWGDPKKLEPAIAKILESRDGILHGLDNFCAHFMASRIGQNSLTRQMLRDKLRPFENSQRKEAHFMPDRTQKTQEMKFAVRGTNVPSRSAPVC